MEFDVAAARRCWGWRIRSRRAEVDLSLRDLAAVLAINTGHLSRIERGLIGVGDGLRLRIADALDSEPDSLWSYSETISNGAR